MNRERGEERASFAKRIFAAEAVLRNEANTGWVTPVGAPLGKTENTNPMA
jgi:hypothetical protein